MVGAGANPSATSAGLLTLRESHLKPATDFISLTSQLKSGGNASLLRRELIMTPNILRLLGILFMVGAAALAVLNLHRVADLGLPW